jgi:hypothetical protein
MTDRSDGSPEPAALNDSHGWSELEAGLRETWPELESSAPETWPESRDETVEMIARLTGASTEEVQRRIDALDG